MKSTEKKAQFIELRAQGNSYSKIAEALQISKSTCTAWEQELNTEIAEQRAEHLQELYRLYAMSKEARIKRIGETLQGIEDALAQKDLAVLPADKLLELKLKYERELKAEYTEPTPPLTENTLDAILVQYKAVLEKGNSGEYTPAQTKAQLAIIGETAKTMRGIEYRDNPFDLSNGF